MDETETARYRKRLQALRAGLDEEEALGAEGQRVVTLDQQSVGRLARMDALQHQAMAKAQGARRAAARARINAALRRIAEGEYGYCLDCGEVLEASRLESDPSVPRCLDCTRG
ncbi:TraR/DksA family transcriptional regulator [Aestuariibius sp. 2305UL40-4]|uniref:TraR/DksA family transcriptional regulator n=1 Tax=Aestuariibius violaceus TaxID=3234132 RepID=UPI00345ED6E7